MGAHPARVRGFAGGPVTKARGTHVTDPDTPPPAPEVKQAPRGPGPRQTKIGIHHKSHCQHQGSSAAQSQINTDALTGQDVSRAQRLTPRSRKGPPLSLEHVGLELRTCQVNPLLNTHHMPGLSQGKDFGTSMFYEQLCLKRVVGCCRGEGNCCLRSLCALGTKSCASSSSSWPRDWVPAPRVFTCLTLLGTSTVSQMVSVRSSLQAVAGVRATQ